eukprot:gene9855-10866_t
MKEKEESTSTQMNTFLVNKSGFPLKEETMNELWNYVVDNFQDGSKYESELRGKRGIPKTVIPSLPSTNPSMSLLQKLEGIQNYMNQLQYNHTGMQFFEVKKCRSISGLMEVAKQIIKESLPIKCLEAVILSIYLTTGMTELQRFTISFRSQFGKNSHRHVVLGLCTLTGSNFGALGMSRRGELMYKPLNFKSLSNLILDYIQAYEICQHRVKKVKLSLPIVHDLKSCERINWRYLSLSISKMNEKDIKTVLDKYSKSLRIM